MEFLMLDENHWSRMPNLLCAHATFVSLLLYFQGFQGKEE
jgi:hypothetical protein